MNYKNIVLLFLIISNFLIIDNSSCQYPYAPQEEQKRIAGSFGEHRGGGNRYHYGVDFPLGAGEDVLAIEDGDLYMFNDVSLAVGTYGYIHVRVNTDLCDMAPQGCPVTAGTKIGTVQDITSDHIHLQQSTEDLYIEMITAWEDPHDIWINPMFFLSPFQDTEDPVIDRAELYRQGTNDEITEDLILFGQIDLLVSCEDDGINADGSANTGNHLAPLRTYFEIISENEVLLEHPGIDFEEIPSNNSAAVIFGNAATDANWEVWLTNDPFELPYNKYWNSRQIISGEYNNTTDIPKSSKFEGEVISFLISSNDYDFNDDEVRLPENEEEFYVVDNFQPFINRFQIIPNITGPLENEAIFEYIRSQSENGTTLNDGLISNQSARIDNDNTVSNVQFNILMSEPMEEMSVRYRYEGGQYTEWNEMSTAFSNPLTWTFEIDDFVDGCILFNFRGEDKAGNGIINVFEETSSNTLGNNLFIPTRSGNNSWNNNPSFVVGEDFFNTCTDCANLIESVAECDEIEDFVELSYVDCNESYFVELNGIDEEFEIGWLNENNEYIAGGSIHPAAIGQNCYVIQDENGCCSFQGCIEVTGEERYADNFAYAFTDGPSSSTKNISISTEADGLNYPIMIRVIDANGSNVCGRQISNSEESANCIGIVIGDSYCIEYVDDSGCVYESCFTTPGESCSDPIFVTADNIIPECENSYNGAINILIEGNPCERYVIKWDNGWEIGEVGQNEFQLTGLETGNYCVIIADVNCNKCETSACFEVPEVSGPCGDGNCDKILANEVLITTDFIFHNTSTNTCDGGSFTFDAIGSSAFPVRITVASQANDGCISNSSIQLTESDQVGSFEVDCLSSNSQNCAGKYCFNVERPGCPISQFCRTIDFCRGSSRDSRKLGCLKEVEAGGISVSRPFSTETNPIEVGQVKTAQLQDNSTSLMLTKVYPNPFTTDINIQLESTDHQTVQVHLTDIYGRTVIREIQQLTKGVNLIKLQLSNNLASGIYALTIIDEDQKKYNQLLTRMNN